MKVIDHISELRKRLINILFSIFLFFIAGVTIAPRILEKIILDLRPEGVNIVSLSPVELILTEIFIGLVIASALASPIIFYHLIAFILPGAKKKETQGIFYLLPVFFLLFALGAMFGYFIFVKIVLKFLANLSSGIVLNTWSIQKFISFILTITFLMGIVFQLPLIIVILKSLNLVSARILSKKRAYIYVGLFVIAAVITPPDILTQILFAVPLIILYEISLLIIRLI